MTVPKEVAAALGCLAAVFTAAAVGFSPAQAQQRGQALPDSSPPPSAQVRGVGRPSAGTSIRLLQSDGTVATLPLEEYVQGVVTAEMPASFQPAALEAQAVCARTYALSRAQAGSHGPEADVCADPGCCQAYAAEDPADWGPHTEEYSMKLRAAVQATQGQVLRSDGKLISAVFHASSAGYTAPAQAVWGAQVPYLVSVSTPETPETVPKLESEATFPSDEFRSIFLEKHPEADLSGAPSGWFGPLERADWGGVERVSIGGVSLTGSQVRSLFGLRSARFDVAAGETAVTFHVSGYGHGVGMSQYGANLLAQEGQSCKEILEHYYPGAELGGL